MSGIHQATRLSVLLGDLVVGEPLTSQDAEGAWGRIRLMALPLGFSSSTFAPLGAVKLPSPFLGLSAQPH